jgi:hypothetical protein
MLISICGYKRHGKDSIADYLVRDFGFVKCSFAVFMKDAVKIIFDWTDEHVYGNLKEVVDERWGISPRQALQNIGTEYGQKFLCESFPEFKRVVGRKLWVKRFCNWYNLNKHLNVVICDLRFPHEQEELEKYKSIFWKVIRSGYEIDMSHESEQYVDVLKADYTFINDGLIEDLELKVKDVIGSI